MSHLGRPEGKGFEAEFSLKPVAQRLSELLGKPVKMAPAVVGPAVRDLAHRLRDGEVLLLENVRFEKAEKKGDEPYASELASLGEVYCNDAFGTCHRTEGSMYAVPRAIKGRGGPAVVGFLVQKEIRFLSEVLHQPQRPFVAILGGAKVSDKVPAIRNLLSRVDSVLIGGAMAYTLLLAQGKTVGRSRVERDQIPVAREILEAAARSKAKLLLPEDHVCGKELSGKSPTQVANESIPEDWMGLDIGPKTISRFAGVIASARTVVWNGPVGAFEVPPFDVGTRRIAKALADATSRGATTIIGGGDSAAAIEQFGLADQVSHVSTGGGASLEMLEGKSFASVEILDEA
jgi:phosphoglycerate kinase